MAECLPARESRSACYVRKTPIKQTTQKKVIFIKLSFRDISLRFHIVERRKLENVWNVDEPHDAWCEKENKHKSDQKQTDATLNK